MSRIKVENIRHPDGTGDNILLTDTGRVGIGTSPAERLTIEDGTNVVGGFGALAYNSYSNEGLGLTFGASNDGSRIMAIGVVDTNKLAITGREGIVFTVGGAGTYAGTSEIARFDDAGRLLVGTSTAANTSTSAKIQAIDSGSGGLILGRDDSSVTTDDTLGYILFMGNDGGSYENCARIRARADGTHASGDKPTYLEFSTTADGASSPTERVRITKDGSVYFNNTTQPSTTQFGTWIGGGSLEGYFSTSRNGGSASAVVDVFGNAGQFIVRGDGDCENTNNRYTGISDIKFKQNIEDATSQWDDIKAIQVRKYELIAHPERRHIGVVAQELEQVCPGLVIERLNEETNETYKSVAYSVLYMKAVKALQEAQLRIEQLETQNASFEARLTALEGGQP